MHPSNPSIPEDLNCMCAFEETHTGREVVLQTNAVSTPKDTVEKKDKGQNAPQDRIENTLKYSKTAPARWRPSGHTQPRSD